MSIRSRSIISALLFVSGVLFAQSGKNVWKADLDDDAKTIQPVLNGAYLFGSADEYAWLFRTSTGKKVWSVEIDDYSKKALHQVVDDTLYLVAEGDTLKCFDMLNNTLVWKRIYSGIEQSNFTAFSRMDTLYILSYGSVDLGISTLDGKEAWRSAVTYESSLREQGTVDRVLLPLLRKYLAFTDKDECVLIDAVNGKRLITIPLSEPNGDLIKAKRAWYYISADQRTAAFISEKQFIVLNTDTNRLLAQVALKVSDQYNVLMPTPVGCAVFGEDRIVHLNTLTGKLSQAPAKLEDIRNSFFVQTDSAAILVIVFEDKVIGWNLDIGRAAWTTALKFQPSKGYLHRFIAQDSNDIVVTYIDPSTDLKLYLMSINAANGKIGYRTLIAHADESLPKRELPVPPIAVLSGPVQPSFGFENVGFDFQTIVSDTNIVILIRTASDMKVPNSDKEGGEGFIRVDRKSGQVISKSYLKVAQGLSFDGGLNALAPVTPVGSLILYPGNKNLVALDAQNGAVRWMLIDQDLKKSYIFDMAMVDTVLYVRTGAFKAGYEYDAKKDKLKNKTEWEENDYTLLAVDTASGKVLWKREFEADPGRAFRSYSINRYTRDSSNLIFGDERFLYSLALSPAKKGMLAWKFELSDSGVGSLDYDDLIQRSWHWSAEPLTEDEKDAEGMFTLKTRMVAGETFTTGLTKILHTEYDRATDRLLVYGDDGIASVNAANGRKNWLYEWDYKANAIQQAPVRLKGSIFYVINGDAVLLNAATGAVQATASADKESGIFLMPDRSAVVIVNGDEMTGIAIP